MINFSDPQTRYLIDYANLKQGLIKHQNEFLSEKKFKEFEKKKIFRMSSGFALGN